MHKEGSFSSRGEENVTEKEQPLNQQHCSAEAAATEPWCTAMAAMMAAHRLGRRGPARRPTSEHVKTRSVWGTLSNCGPF